MDKGDKRRKEIQYCIRPTDDIHVFIFLQNFGLQSLSHASQDPNLDFGIVLSKEKKEDVKKRRREEGKKAKKQRIKKDLLEQMHISEPSPDPLLSILPDGTRNQKNDICLVKRGGPSITGLLHDGPNNFCI